MSCVAFALSDPYPDTALLSPAMAGRTVNLDLSLLFAIWSRHHQWDPYGHICLYSVFQKLNEMPGCLHKEFWGEILMLAFVFKTRSSDVVAVCLLLGYVQALWSTTGTLQLPSLVSPAWSKGF